MRLILFAFITSVLVSSCSFNSARILRPDSIKKFLADIDAHNREVEQIKASLDVKATGVLGGFIHEQVDVIVKEPHYLYWSLRSFFGPPAMLLASNGEFLTIYDFSQDGIEAYQKIALKDDSFFELMDFRFHPKAIINLLLGKIPLDGATNIKLTMASADKLEISADLQNGWRLWSLFDPKNRRVLDTKLTNEGLFASYQVKYAHYEEISGIHFPKMLILHAKGRSRFAKFAIHFLTIELNGDPVLPDVFYLERH